jgi:predicted ester cyclase
MTTSQPVEVIRELIDRTDRGDPDVLDLVAVDMVNHAAGPQGREGLRTILATLEHDLGPLTATTHHLFGEGELVTQHMTMHGTHRASTMPLLTGVTASGKAVEWEFIHIWRVLDGEIVEHWATRDDLGLLVQLRTEPQSTTS